MDSAQQPTVRPFFFRAQAQQPDFYVDGNELVVRDGTVLPAVCVKTNQPVAIENVKKEQFTWCSPWIGLLFLISGPLLIIVYFLVRKHCSLTYGLHPDFRKQRAKRTRWKVIVAVFLFIAIPFLAAFDNPAVATIGLVAFIVSIIAIFVGNAPLHIRRHSEGGFWVRGFSPEYIASISKME